MATHVTVEVEGFRGMDVPVGVTLLEVCEDHDIPMDSACGGFACCNSCRVCVLDGAENLTPAESEEDAFLDVPGQRLGCQAHVLGPVVVRLDPGM